MATVEPLTGATVYEQTDAALGGQQLGDVVRDVAPFTVPRHSSAATRDTAYASFVSGGGTMANGMVSTTTDAAGGLWLRKSGAWSLELADTGWINLTLTASFTAVTGTGVPGAKYRVKNGVCHFRFRITHAADWTGPISPFTFPSGARPTTAEYFRVTKDATDGISSMLLTVFSTGVAELNNNGQGGNSVYASGSFLVD